MTPEALKVRADRIRIPVRTIAQRSGLDEMTVHRIFRGDVDPRLSSLQKIDGVIAAEEAAIRSALADPSDASPGEDRASDTPPGRSEVPRRAAVDRAGSSISKIS